MNRYIDDLEGMSRVMHALAEELGRQQARPLRLWEKQLIRLAVFSKVSTELSDATNLFVSGKQSPDCGFLLAAARVTTDDILLKFMTGKRSPDLLGFDSPTLLRILTDLED